MGRETRKRQKTNVSSSSREASSSTVPRTTSQNESNPRQIDEPQPIKAPLRVSTYDIVFTWTDYQERLECLKALEHLITKFVDIYVLRKFKFENGVRTFLKKGGWEGFLDIGASSYPWVSMHIGEEGV